MAGEATEGPAVPEPLEPAEVAEGTQVTKGAEHQAVPVPVPVPDTGYTAAGVPTLQGVQEKIEARYGTALGATELAEDTPEARAAADQYEARQKAAAAKLDEIRASMRKKQD